MTIQSTNSGHTIRSVRGGLGGRMCIGNKIKWGAGMTGPAPIVMLSIRNRVEPKLRQPETVIVVVPEVAEKIIVEDSHTP